MKNLKETLCVLLLAATACNERTERTATACNERTETVQQEPKIPRAIVMTFLTKENLEYTLPLECFQNQVAIYITPRRIRRLHFYEASAEDKPTIMPEEYFIATDALNRTRVVEYTAAKPQLNELWFWDMSGYATARVPYDPNTRTATLELAGVPRRIHLDEKHRLAIDQNGDGKINGMQSPIIRDDDKVILEEDLLSD